MANPLYNEQVKRNPLGSFMSNPMDFLHHYNIDVPSQYVNDPRGFVQYLVSNNKMSQDTLNTLMQKAQQMGYKF